MSGELIPFPAREAVNFTDLRDRMEKLAAIFTAIDAGELLAALPECPVARDNHRTALNLLSIIEVEIRCMCAELES